MLTSSQIADIAFTSLRKAQDRLVTLHRLDVVDRFRPRRWAGSGPFHFTLGPAGATVVAADRGVDVADLRWRRDGAGALAVSQRLAHTVGVNGFFTALVRTTRTRPGCDLAQWWSERRTTDAWGTLVRPDGYGVWVENGTRLPFLLEYDTGTERLARLSAKLNGYADLARAAGHRTWVLFAFPTPGREAAARPMLTHPLVPVATTALPTDRSPADQHWLPVGQQGQRQKLVSLAHHHLPTGDPQARGLSTDGVTGQR